MKKLHGLDYTIAFAGNPNVGKTSIFNNLTGMHQHTGNWPGKTVSNAYGKCSYNGKNFLLVDLPGTYSLMSNSSEEEIARDYICFGNPDLCVVVVDATCLERNLNLVFQILEMSLNVVICVNLLDEAKKKSIEINLELLSDLLGVPVIGTIANKPKTLKKLLSVISSSLENKNNNLTIPSKLKYSPKVEECISMIEESIKSKLPDEKQYLSRWISLKLLDENISINEALKSNLHMDIDNDSDIQEKLNQIKSNLNDEASSITSIRDSIVSSIVSEAEKIREKTCIFANSKYNLKSRKIDKILTSKKFGIPIMIVFLAVIFWITIAGANYPSSLLSNMFGAIQDKLLIVFYNLHIPEFWTNLLIYRYVSNCNMGRLSYASSYGYFLSTVYFA